MSTHKSLESKKYIEELEDKIVALSLQYKSKANELNLLNESHEKSVGKLIHNLRNPIGVIFSFSDMILEDLDDYTPDKLEKHIQIIKSSAAFSLKMITTVAKNTQLNSPEHRYDFKTINFVELVNEVINELTENALMKNCIIKTDIENHPIHLSLDLTEISVALKHIINNAIRYSDENSVVKIILKENENTVDIAVIDQGIGISEENLGQIFKEFFVVNTYSEDKQKCIGLGLSIANKIIKDHKGKISATSSLNKGSTFKITLPK
ncbi:MAG: HAMP domain-containing histidine kinase [Lutibacter sp.]|uniref:sensor histidine kinase n=1 Tax=Lutibacter sp. TaxID=1925666 RepID=UPI0018356486|nr:HAMP domain-containing sensor histidine kinase [Lutibacter sp.]MBT8318219.1 HAMP domain-containing histidine kinase [Lutibacter sp.]NNJ59078.1 HAMP domain-containing histidine kinase [Lutibacter sp.]